MNRSPYVVTPRDWEEAKAKVVEREQAWRQHQFAQVDPSTLEKHRRIVEDLAEDLEMRQNDLSALERRVRALQAEVDELWHSLEDCHRRRLPTLPMMFGVFGIPLGLLIGSCAGARVRPAFGMLVGFITICMTFLTALSWFYVRQASADTTSEGIEEILPYSERRLKEARTQVADAEVLVFQSYERWEKDHGIYTSLIGLNDLKRAYEEARWEYERLSNLAKSCQYQMLHSNWRALRGIPFEEFLRQVFELLGYTVEMTKASGDEGLDLILMGKGRRIGIQAKGYEESVGVKAIQEAYTGMVAHQCDCCLVITNSTFTGPAKELAHKVGCRLLSGNDIQDLIMGKIIL